MTQAFKWWKDPTTDDEITVYVEALFEHAGQNLWTKILKPFIGQDIKESITSKINPVK